MDVNVQGWALIQALLSFRAVIPDVSLFIIPSFIWKAFRTQTVKVRIW